MNDEKEISIPSQGGTEIGPWLYELASQCPGGSSIVEVGCWLGAGTYHLARGALHTHNPAVEVHCYDRWTANEQEIEKARKFGVELRLGEDTLPRVQKTLSSLAARVYYHKGDIREAQWDGRPIALYVDDATKVDSLWRHAMKTFRPSFILGAHLVLMDYHFDEKAGPAYAAQKRYMAQHSEFRLVQERLGGTTTAIFQLEGMP